MSFADSYFDEKLNRRKSINAFRELSVSEGMVDFCSNDYLGLARLSHSVSDSPSGSGGSRLLSGNHSISEEVEYFLADFFNASSGLIFNSGYDANLGVFSCIAGKDHIILYDEDIHASIRDGLRLSQAKSYKFRHNDLNHLESLLQKWQGHTIWVAVESVYSMDGSLAPLIEMATLKEKYSFEWIVDEAHSGGIYGPKGEGLCVANGISEKVTIRLMTFGKAFGNHGAIVLGSEKLRSYLINYARSFIYTTAPSPSYFQEIKSLFLHFEKHYTSLREGLQRVIDQWNQLAKTTSFETLTGSSPIQGIFIPGNDEVKQLTLQLRSHQLDARPILSPTVSKGKERIRICLHNYNKPKELELLFQLLGD